MLYDIYALTMKYYPKDIFLSALWDHIRKKVVTCKRRKKGVTCKKDIFRKSLSILRFIITISRHTLTILFSALNSRIDGFLEKSVSIGLVRYLVIEMLLLHHISCSIYNVLCDICEILCDICQITIFYRVYCTQISHWLIWSSLSDHCFEIDYGISKIIPYWIRTWLSNHRFVLVIFFYVS